MVIGEDEYESHYNVEDLTEHILRFSLPAFGLQKPFYGVDERRSAEVGTEP